MHGQQNIKTCFSRFIFPPLTFLVIIFTNLSFWKLHTSQVRGHRLDSLFFRTCFCLFVIGATAPQWAMASSFTRFVNHKDAPQSVGLLWTSDQLVAETSTWQHTSLTIDIHPCHRWDSNPQSHQASGRRPTPLTGRTLGSAHVLVGSKFCISLIDSSLREALPSFW